MRGLAIYIAFVAGSLAFYVSLGYMPSLARYVVYGLVILFAAGMTVDYIVSQRSHEAFMRWFDANWGWRLSGDHPPIDGPKTKDNSGMWLVYVLAVITVLAIGKLIYDVVAT